MVEKNCLLWIWIYSLINDRWKTMFRFCGFKGWKNIFYWGSKFTPWYNDRYWKTNFWLWSVNCHSTFILIFIFSNLSQWERFDGILCLIWKSFLRIMSSQLFPYSFFFSLDLCFCCLIITLTDLIINYAYIFNLNTFKSISSFYF